MRDETAAAAPSRIQTGAAPLHTPDPYLGRDRRRAAYAALDLGTNNCRLLIAEPTYNGFRVIDVQSVAQDQADRWGSAFTDLFVVLGAFSLFSGMLLIVLVFSLVALERRTELGISRALGARRRDVILLLALEGGLYSVISSLFGLGGGLALALAIIALAGGFITPFLASNGKGNYVVLFTYLLILNGGLLVIAYNKIWRLLNILAFGFTAVLYASWLISLPYDAPSATYRGGWIFASIFYLLFFVINIAYTIRSRKPFIASDFIILLVNTCLYFAAGLYLIEQLGLDRYKGWFSAGLGVFHLGAIFCIPQSCQPAILYQRGPAG